MAPLAAQACRRGPAAACQLLPLHHATTCWPLGNCTKTERYPGVFEVPMQATDAANGTALFSMDPTGGWRGWVADDTNATAAAIWPGFCIPVICPDLLCFLARRPALKPCRASGPCPGRAPIQCPADTSLTTCTLPALLSLLCLRAAGNPQAEPQLLLQRRQGPGG